MAEKKSTKQYSLRRCRECGFPRFVSMFIKWNDNGTMTQFMRKDFRVVVLHFGFIDNLFANIEARLGISIEHIAFEAQRNAARETFKALYDRVPGSNFFRKLGFIQKMGVEQFNKVGDVTGQCYSETLEYKPGEYGVARIKNPFNLNLMAANVVGAFECLENKPFTHTWEEEAKDSYIIRIQSTGEKPEIAERMELEFPELIPGHLEIERCPKCKVPRALSHLKWLENEGLILDTRTGSRVVMLDGYMVSTVFREMARELGDEINDLLVDAQRAWTVDHVEQLGMTRMGGGSSRAGRLQTSYRGYLGMLPLYGQGNPINMSIEEDRVAVTVENPYEPRIIAGTLQGLFEALEMKKGKVDWGSPRPGIVTYEVTPEDSRGTDILYPF